MDNAKEQRQSRATVWAALIGAIGTIVAAIAGHWVGREQSADKLADSQKQLTVNASEITALRQTLENQGTQIHELQKRLQLAGVNPNIVIAQADTTDTKTDHEFKIHLITCGSNGGLVNCDFLVTNLAGDRQLSLRNDASRVISDGGDEYFASNMTIGANEGPYVARGVLPGGVPVKARLQFGHVRPGTTKLQMLEFAAYTWNQGGGREDVLAKFGPTDLQ